MRTSLTVLAFACGLLLSEAALADDDCFVPMMDWQPREAVSQMAVRQGWTVRRIKIDDGCYQIIGQDADGQGIKVLLHPQTLEIVEHERLSDRKNRGRKGDHEDDD